MFLLFKVTESHQKAMSKVRTIVCCCKYYQTDFRYEAKAPRREALVADNLALPLIFFYLSKFLQFVKFVLPII